ERCPVGFEVFGCEAVLRVFARNIDLQQEPRPQAEFSRESVDSRCQRQAVDRMHALGDRQNFADLVALQVPDQVPMDWRGDLRGPFEQLLRTTFSQVANALGDERLDPFKPGRLGDSDEKNVRRSASDPAAGSVDPRANPRKVLSDPRFDVAHGLSPTALDKDGVRWTVRKFLVLCATAEPKRL